MSNPYGHFDDSKREYVITRPDTPLPWLNFLGQDELYGLCTNTGGGYTFWRDAKLRRLTRYRYNNIPMDVGGRYLYISDGEDIWNPGWKPMKTPLDQYECRHGLGYSRILGRKNEIEAETTFFVPPDENNEVWSVRLKNDSSKPRKLKLFSFVEFCFYEALNDMTNFQRTFSIGEVEVEGGAIYHKTEFRERRSHYTMFACTREVDGFDTSRDAFVGVHNGLHEPAAVLAGKPTNSIAHGWSPIGSHFLEIELKPGEETRFAFVLAYVQVDPNEKFEGTGKINKAPATKVLEHYRDINSVDEAFGRLQNRWETLLSNFQVELPDPVMNRMVNTWNQYQVMATFNLSRSASLYESGIGRGMGYRDSNQDLLGFVHMIAPRARERLLDIAATQNSDGSCFHQYQPLTKQGNADIGGGFMDDHLWLILSTCAYIKETGDVSVLESPVGYADQPDSEATLMDHLLLSIDYTMKERGPHSLPLIGHADWNDCLNLNCFSKEPNESFQTAGDVEGSKAESLMIAGLFLVAADDMEQLLRFLGDEEHADIVSRSRGQMLEAIEHSGWDGEWYLRAFDANGNPVGSKQNQHGQIYIESQGWCIMGGAGRHNGRARKALDSVKERLATPNGIVLQDPAYQDYHLELGEVSSYPPGYKENGGIFCHNNPWIQLSHIALNDGDQAFDYYLSVCPAAKEDQIDTYRSEPYVYAQMIAGKEAPTFGEAKNSWLTGTAAWSFTTATQGFLGIKPDYEGLRIEPCIPSKWDGFKVTRRFRGITFDIEVKNPEHVCGGVKSVAVNGKQVEGSIVRLDQLDGERVNVEVVLG